MSGIIDAHSHYMPPEVAKNTAFFKVNWSDLDRQLAVMDEHGKVLYRVVNVTDITKQKMAEVDRRESETRYSVATQVSRTRTRSWPRISPACFPLAGLSTSR